ncbi:hypothetical protein ACP4B2_05285 [Streptomyces rochei]|uniref:hypothetical protein n=1 Tax=Streptomyces rochei TaxID=1928 RepID=UPI003D2AE380
MTRCCIWPFKRSIETSGATRRIVILDCCYSAHAFGVQSESVAALAEIDGILMAAAAETAVALPPPGEPHTAFTGELLELLRGGVASPNEFLDLDAVFGRGWQQRGHQLPQVVRNKISTHPDTLAYDARSWTHICRRRLLSTSKRGRVCR